MKLLFTVILIYIRCITVNAQIFDVNGLKSRLAQTDNDTLRLAVSDSLALLYSEINPDSSLFYANQETNLSRKLGFRLSEAFAMDNQAYALLNLGSYPAALRIFLSAIEIASDKKNEKKILPVQYRSVIGATTSNPTTQQYRYQILGWLHFNLGILYENARIKEKELQHYKRALQLGEATGNLQMQCVTSLNLGRFYLSQNKIDSALLFEKKAYELGRNFKAVDYSGSILLNLGRVYLAKGDKKEGIAYVQKAIKTSSDQKYYRGVIAGNLLLADLNIKDKNIDSASIYATTALAEAINLNLPDLLLRSYITLSDYYKLINKPDSIVKYQNLIIKFKDSLFNSSQARQFQNIDFDEMQRQQELETAKKDYRDQLQKYSLYSGLAVFLLIAIILWRSYSNKQKAYLLLQEEKQKTDFQKAMTEQTLEKLKATQAQLIHSEKMASLGELTAGIAHEIQNPLNFVNNFSEVNKELITELKDDLGKGKTDEAKTIADNIDDNEERIIQHGKRADAIVKQMLQHSKKSSGRREPTDISALCQEYLVIAYNGQAKDKSLSEEHPGIYAKYETHFDSTLPKIEVVPQEIGKVMLNIFNNAFYAVNEKAKQNIEGYKPTVTVNTKKDGDQISISVKDNGTGIPDSIKEKIFQPFFTTKPTGSGTGLGLSLSYDIVKAHGGEIKMETKEGEGTQFIIQLPA